MMTKSPKPIPFSKMQGIGNDFILIDNRTHFLPASFPSTKEGAALCHRRFGIGADGILLITPSTKADAKLEIWNHDGSPAEMCGNGLRCAAKYIFDSFQISGVNALSPNVDILFFETKAGILSCTLRKQENQSLLIETAMGSPKFQRKDIPMVGPKEEIAQDISLSIQDQIFSITAVSMGNPHVVLFFPTSDDLQQLAQTYGPLIENHSLFPQKINVNFAYQKSPTEIDLVVWERGCGITQACGTGASATLAATCSKGNSPFDAWVKIHLLGGTLEVKVLSSFENIFVKGPAEEVFQGSLKEVPHF